MGTRAFAGGAVVREELRTPPQPPAPHCQRLDGAFNGRVPHLARSTAPTSRRCLAPDNQDGSIDQTPSSVVYVAAIGNSAVVLLLAVRLHGGVSGGGDALGGLSSSAVGGSATLSGNTVAVLIGGEMDVRRGRDGNLLLAAVQCYRNMQ